MASEMTDEARQWAEAVIQSCFLSNEREWRTWYAVANSGTAQQPAPHGVANRLVDAYKAHGDREYRRGLEAAANVVRAQAGGLTREAFAGCGNEDDVAEGAANDALRYAADTLDRLAQEARRT